jgi:hypothetical protein
MKLNMLNAKSWLFLELVIITVVAWAVLDPAVVNLYYRSLPLGYDSSQLLYAETAVNGEWNELVYAPQDPFKITEERRQQMLRQLSNVEGVASVYLYGDDCGLHAKLFDAWSCYPLPHRLEPLCADVLVVYRPLHFYAQHPCEGKTCDHTWYPGWYRHARTAVLLYSLSNVPLWL